MALGHPSLATLKIHARIACPGHLQNAVAGAALTRFTEMRRPAESRPGQALRAEDALRRAGSLDGEKKGAQ